MPRMEPHGPGEIRRFNQPLEMRAPKNEADHKLIKDTAKVHPSWGRITIYERLRDLGHAIDQPEVNYVLYHHKLSNLYL